MAIRQEPCLAFVPSRGPEKVALVDEQNWQNRCSKQSQQCKIPCGSPVPRLCSSGRNAGDVYGSYGGQKNGEEDRHAFACGLTTSVSDEGQPPLSCEYKLN